MQGNIIVFILVFVYVEYYINIFSKIHSGQDAEVIAQAPPNTRLVLALKKITLDRISLEIEMHKKIFQTELEYQQRLKEFDDKRRMIVAGDYIPTDDECKYQYADPEEPVVETNEKGIPKFWSTIFSNLDILSDMVQPHDQEAISLITDIRCVLLDNPMVRIFSFALCVL